MAQAGHKAIRPMSQTVSVTPRRGPNHLVVTEGRFQHAELGSWTPGWNESWTAVQTSPREGRPGGSCRTLPARSPAAIGGSLSLNGGWQQATAEIQSRLQYNITHLRCIYVPIPEHHPHHLQLQTSVALGSPLKVSKLEPSSGRGRDCVRELICQSFSNVASGRNECIISQPPS